MKYIKPTYNNEVIETADIIVCWFDIFHFLLSPYAFASL